MGRQTICPDTARVGLGAFAGGFALIVLLLPVPCFSQTTHPPALQNSVRTVAELQRLTADQASQAIPVELDGVVTYSDPEWGLLFFHDPSGPLFVLVAHGRAKARYPAGERIHLSGVTSDVDGSPFLAQPKIRVLGQGKLPVPERRSLAELNAQLGDSQIVVTKGVLQSCDVAWDRVCYRIFDGETKAWVVLPEPNSPAAQRLIGSAVEVTGVSGGHQDASGKRVGAQIFVDKLEDIEVEKLAAAGPIPVGNKAALKTVNAIERLSNAQAARALPVELQGVATYSDPEWGLLFVRDSTGSIYINAHATTKAYASGTRLLIDGVTGAGDVGPIVVQPKIQVIGHESLPNPVPKSVAELDAGAADSSLVATEGVLHPCDETWTRICYRILDGKKQAWVIVPYPDSPAAQALIGARVRVKGVSGVHLDDQKKRVAAQIFVNSMDDIKVEEPVLKDPFSSPPTPIVNLDAAAADQRFAHQVHIRGTVTWESPERFIVQDHTGGISVRTAKGVLVRPGSIVDLVGFLDHGVLTPLLLSDSMMRVSATQSKNDAIETLNLTAEEILEQSLSGKRVRVRARLLSQTATATGYVYLLEDGDRRFTATLLRNDPTREIVGLARNSLLELTGVPVIQGGTPKWPVSLMILIESPSDMVVLEGNSWLTLKRGLAILFGMAVCIVAPLVWVRMLRRTVRKQTAIIRARLENELRMETRYQRLFERNLAAVFSWRSDGTIVDCNMAFVKMLGLRSREELIGRSYWDFEVDPIEREQLGGTLTEDALSNRDASLRRDDGVKVDLLMNISPVERPDGWTFETTAIDVTQLRLNQSELQRAKDAAVFESLNDPLTGLPNRRLLMDRLSFLLEKARRDGTMIALLYMDLDGFKLVNDSLGHPVGDALLVQVADCLRSWVRENDVLARLGGDEFMVILDRLQDREDATMVAENLLDAISSPFHVEGHDLAIGASIGICIFPDSASNAEEMMRKADSAMYAAKREGKNRVMNFTSEIGSLVHERLNLENLLRGAISRHEISVHYQPEFEVIGGRLVRFEALARWSHPTLGQIPPVKFIPIAEESGMIVALGAYIMERACNEAAQWQSILPYPIQVAVNVSSIQFRRKGFVEEVSGILRRTGLRPELLQIEVTESVILSGAHSSTEIMNRLRKLGISLAVDDFGTGYSSLSYLPFLPFDALKIDRSFVTNLDAHSQSESMIPALIALAHNTGMRVIVEGVETQEQLDLIRAFGAEEVQGYLLGRPTPNPIEQFILKAEDTLKV